MICSNCFACIMPARVRLVRLLRESFFSHLTMEKSFSTDVVFGNAIANPPHK